MKRFRWFFNPWSQLALEALLVTNFPRLSREEIQAMLNFTDLRDTRYFQEVLAEGKLEGKLELVPQLAELGLSVEKIAAITGINAEIIEKYLKSTAAT